MLAAVESEVAPVGPDGDRADVGYDRGAQGDHPHPRRAGAAGVEARAALRPEPRTCGSSARCRSSGWAASPCCCSRTSTRAPRSSPSSAPTAREMLDLIEKARPTRLLGWTVLERLQADPSFAGRDLGWIDELEVPPLVADGRRHSSLGMSETSGPHTLFPTLENLVELPGSASGLVRPADPGHGAPDRRLRNRRAGRRRRRGRDPRARRAHDGGPAQAGAEQHVRRRRLVPHRRPRLLPRRASCSSRVVPPR